MGKYVRVQYEPQRYPKVPWFYEASELRRQSDPPLCMAEDGDCERIDGWRIVAPREFGDEMLIVRAQRGNGNDGGVIELSIATMAQQPVMDMSRLVSNPARHDEGD
jgi:hypothetical protein